MAPPMVESSASAIMHHGQLELPALPVPPLDQTLDRYLSSVRPLLSDEEYAATQKAVEEFRTGDGPRLQQLLEERRLAKSETSWLEEFWNHYAYHSSRVSTTFYHNYFFGFRNDGRHPPQCARAALLIAYAIKFRKLIQLRQLKPDMLRKKAFCMYMYDWMFNACRIPDHPYDQTKSYDNDLNNHIAVARKGHFFILETVHPVEERILTNDEIMSQLEKIKEIADNLPEEPGIGYFTTDNRDEWAKSFKLLMKANPENAASFEKLASALFLVCLDEKSPETREDFSRELWHGDGKNRWFDKCFQIIVFENGKAGYNGEHSMMDGTTTSRLSHFVVESAENDILPTLVNISNLPTPQKLNFSLTTELEARLEQSRSQFYKEVSAHELSVLVFDRYGKDAIKKLKASPDAFVQMAIQFAYYRMMGRVNATYESAATRRYRHGRTETIRSVTNESKRWLEAMVDPNTSDEERTTLLRKAIDKHVEYTNWAVSGNGVDRHLLGLKLLAEKENSKLPSIFTDPSYSLSSHWNLSTSQITDDAFEEYGWGEVVPDGFGVAYMVKDDVLQFNVVSKGLGSPRLCAELEKALVDIRALLSKPVAKKDEAAATINSNSVNGQAKDVGSDDDKNVQKKDKRWRKFPGLCIN
ncbi:uncharacterized protein VTP21DRAFT_512 [Calcarisporiella thermophila]|uniref:uncharacterized protein n=1 Tax=Calcarisporiella thermophila TaxID=911321 RepID=UPI0037423263